MKVGILTFQNAHNYGAILQLYALKMYLEKLGNEVTVINYINEKIQEEYPIKKSFFVKRDWPIYKKVNRGINNLINNKEYSKKWLKFDDFIKELVNNQQRIYRVEDVKKISDNLDYIICGSDQIWNPKLTGCLDKVYFVDFESKAIKISYAASIGLERFEGEQEKEFKALINNFNNISVREENLKNYIENLDKTKRVEVVLDPTLLLDKQEYEKILIEPKIKEKYLFIYCVLPDKRLIKIAKKIAKQKGLKIIELTYVKQFGTFSHKQILDAGPKEFLGLIKNAEYVVTNSFHGTIFSILFDKKFYTISIDKVNSRIETLLNVTGAISRFVDVNSKINLEEEIDYKKAMENIKKYKETSENFLRKTLEKEQ